MQLNDMAAYQAWAKLFCYPGYDFHVRTDRYGKSYLQGEYDEADIYTDVVERQQTRRWYFSPEMTKSEFVQTGFKCVMTSMEHRVREHFTYRGERVYSPHHNVDALWTMTREEDRDTRTK